MWRFVLAFLACFTLAFGDEVPVLNLFKLGVGDAHEFKSVARHNITTSIASKNDAEAMYLGFENSGKSAYIAELYAGKAEYENHLRSPQYQEFLKAAPVILKGEKTKFNLVPQIVLQKPFAQEASTIVNLAIIELKDGYEHAFKSVVVPEMKQAFSLESGVLAMWAASDESEPKRWYFFEIYASEQAYESHRQTEHFKLYISQSKDMVASKKIIKISPFLLQNRGEFKFEKGQK
ncbi:putative quinol monooxygenase [Campylobacter sp. 19-13652]|uniref:putative quinol monooxygenase n=1 Tax=Campylobacter sp. 19-13652 TaxID=2840180 RepID=UPI001C855F9D|nr:antibiotic biosynthesis monooxygenase [Campylobacter sp. 19-13652]